MNAIRHDGQSMIEFVQKLDNTVCTTEQHAMMYLVETIACGSMQVILDEILDNDSLRDHLGKGYVSKSLAELSALISYIQQKSPDDFHSVCTNEDQDTAYVTFSGRGEYERVCIRLRKDPETSNFPIISFYAQTVKRCKFGGE